MEFTRKPVKTIILCTIFVFIFFAALVGICLDNIAIQGEQDAFVYHGASVFLETESQKLTFEDYKQINDIDHVLGTFVINSSVALPIGSENVKEHTGVDINNSNGSDPLRDYISILSLMDVEHYSLFQREEAVSLIKGEFPDNENKGALIESRYAEQNNLDIGDSLTFQLQDTEKICQFRICGIYKIDSDFVILDSENIVEGIYTFSPYNNILLDYESSIEQMKFEPDYQIGCGIYVDRMENNESVAAALKAIFGDKVKIYLESPKQFRETFGVISIIREYAQMILIGICGIGGILLLIIFTFIAGQYRYECGIFLVLGEKKCRTVLRYIVSMFILVIVSLILAIIIYHFTAESLINKINDTANWVVSQGKENIYVVGPYETPALGQGFQLELNTAIISNIKTIAMIIGYVIGCQLLAMIVPLYQIYTTKTRNILNNK